MTVEADTELALPEGPDRSDDFYHRLRARLRKWLESEEGKRNKWAEYLMFAPDLFHVLCRLMLDKDVSARDKAIFGAVIVYFVSPADLVPEVFVGPAGYVDDILLAVVTLDHFINKNNADVVKKHWAGDEDVLEVIKQILAVATQMVDKGVWQKIKSIFEGLRRTPD